MTLELGGKSPCFVVGDVDLELTIKRITWGKFFNAGQTCVAPDYLLIQEKYYDQAAEYFKKFVQEFYGNDPKESDDYGKIVNQRHFDRLMGYFTKEDILFGGNSNRDACYISPTILKAEYDSSVMKEEIFGPLCPLIKIKSVEDGIQFVNSRPKPLAHLYFY